MKINNQVILWLCQLAIFIMAILFMKIMHTCSTMNVLGWLATIFIIVICYVFVVFPTSFYMLWVLIKWWWNNSRKQL